jgi:hypothetical protein
MLRQDQRGHQAYSRLRESRNLAQALGPPAHHRLNPSLQARRGQDPQSNRPTLKRQAHPAEGRPLLCSSMNFPHELCGFLELSMGPRLLSAMASADCRAGLYKRLLLHPCGNFPIFNSTSVRNWIWALIWDLAAASLSIYSRWHV